MLDLFPVVEKFLHGLGACRGVINTTTLNVSIKMSKVCTILQFSVRYATYRDFMSSKLTSFMILSDYQL